MTQTAAEAPAIEIIAHRGYSARAPENTVASIRLAMEVGATAAEWDIHVSASGTPHLFHDDALERTTSGSGSFAQATDAEIELLDAGSWFDPEFAGEPVPTLTTALSAAAHPLRRIYPEIKAFHTLDDVDRIYDEVEASGWLPNAVFISMKWNALERIRRRSSTTWIGYVVESPDRYTRAVDQAAGDAFALVDPDVRIALGMADVSARAIESGTTLGVWTVNDIETAEKAVAIGVRRLTTNEVGTLLSWARRQGTGAR